jgi:hypothetical protein
LVELVDGIRLPIDYERMKCVYSSVYRGGQTGSKATGYEHKKLKPRYPRLAPAARAGLAASGTELEAAM